MALLGSNLGLVYLGCVLVLFVADRDTAVLFANSLLQGLDVSGVVRMNVPLLEAAIGLLETFMQVNGNA